MGFIEGNMMSATFVAIFNAYGFGVTCAKVVEVAKVAIAKTIEANFIDFPWNGCRNLIVDVVADNKI
jgi:hypothetical protein